MRIAVRASIGIIVVLGIIFVVIQLYLIMFSLFFALGHSDPPAKGDFGGRTQPQWTPDGARILFSHRGSIYAVDSDGTQIHHIHGWANEDEWYAAPNISPDGSRIAYLKRHRDWQFWEDHYWEIATSALDGSDERVLTDLDEDTMIYNSPSWSPDGRNIVFNLMGTIYIMSENGSDIHHISNNQAFSEVHSADLPLSWSPDGQNIGFRAIVYDSTDEERVVAYTTEIDGSNSKELEGSVLPAWSPDGARIALIGRKGRASVRLDRLYTVSPNGSDPYEIATLPGEGIFTSPISWSPDGLKILAGPYVASADGSTLLLLPEPPSRWIKPADSEPDLDAIIGRVSDWNLTSWSPDGSRIAIQTAPYWYSNYEFTIYTAAADGSDPKALVTDSSSKWYGGLGRPGGNPSPAEGMSLVFNEDAIVIYPEPEGGR